MTTPRIRRAELVAVVFTALTFFVLPKPPAAVAPIAIFIVVCILSWSTYLAFRVTRDPGLLEAWGLSPTVHLQPLVRILAPAGAVLIVGGALYAISQGRDLVPPYVWLSLLLYPLWGLIQQWLVQAIVVDNVRALTGAPLPALMLLGGIGFGAIHVEHPWLVVATGLLGAVYVWLFQRYRNLWPLGVAHGWLGSLFYPWVLGLNPIEELVGLLPG